MRTLVVIAIAAVTIFLVSSTAALAAEEVCEPTIRSLKRTDEGVKVKIHPGDDSGCITAADYFEYSWGDSRNANDDSRESSRVSLTIRHRDLLGGRVYVKVRGISSEDGESDWSDTGSIEVPERDLDPPGRIRVEPSVYPDMSHTVLTISWSSSSGADRYEVQEFRGDSNTPQDAHRTSSRSLRVPARPEFESMTFRVRALDGPWASDWSNWAMAERGPPAADDPPEDGPPADDPPADDPPADDAPADDAPADDPPVAESLPTLAPPDPDACKFLFAMDSEGGWEGATTGSCTQQEIDELAAAGDDLLRKITTIADATAITLCVVWAANLAASSAVAPAAALPFTSFACAASSIAATGLHITDFLTSNDFEAVGRLIDGDLAALSEFGLLAGLAFLDAKGGRLFKFGGDLLSSGLKALRSTRRTLTKVGFNEARAGVFATTVRAAGDDPKRVARVLESLAESPDNKAFVDAVTSGAKSGSGVITEIDFYAALKSQGLETGSGFRFGVADEAADFVLLGGNQRPNIHIELVRKTGSQDMRWSEFAAEIVETKAGVQLKRAVGNDPGSFGVVFADLRGVDLNTLPGNGGDIERLFSVFTDVLPNSHGKNPDLLRRLRLLLPDGTALGFSKLGAISDTTRYGNAFDVSHLWR